MPTCPHNALAKVLFLGLALFYASTPCFAKAENKPKKDLSSNRDKSYSPSQLTGGVHGIFNYFYPSVRYERAVASWLTFSITGLYSNATIESAATLFYGGYGSVNIYLDTGGFRGLWLQGGYGAWTMEAKSGGTTERLFNKFVTATLGFRVGFLGCFRLGVSGGLFYQDPVRSGKYDFNVHRTMPVISADFGITF